MTKRESANDVGCSTVDSPGDIGGAPLAARIGRRSLEKSNRERHHCCRAVRRCALRQGGLGLATRAARSREDDLARRRNNRPHRREADRERLVRKALHSRRQHPCFGKSAASRRSHAQAHRLCPLWTDLPVANLDSHGRDGRLAPLRVVSGRPSQAAGSAPCLQTLDRPS